MEAPWGPARPILAAAAYRLPAARHAERARELLALGAALVGDGVRVVECAPQGGALESAYLAMTEERR